MERSKTNSCWDPRGSRFSSFKSAEHGWRGEVFRFRRGAQRCAPKKTSHARYPTPLYEKGPGTAGPPSSAARFAPDLSGDYRLRECHRNRTSAGLAPREIQGWLRNGGHGRWARFEGNARRAFRGRAACPSHGIYLVLARTRRSFGNLLLCDGMQGSEFILSPLSVSPLFSLG